jgi:hypothetical protein
METVGLWILCTVNSEQNYDVVFLLMACVCHPSNGRKYKNKISRLPQAKSKTLPPKQPEQKGLMCGSNGEVPASQAQIPVSTGKKKVFFTFTFFLSAMFSQKCY